MNQEDLEQEARRLREEIYGPIEDAKWADPIKKNWVADIEWLRKTVNGN
jgi:hypothetical protein